METAAPGAGPQLIAQLQDESGDIRLAGRVREDDGQIVLNLAGFQPGENQSPVLWVIPVGADAPVALGTIPAQGRFERQLSAQERELIASGATLAVTIEDDANAPYAAPTTPILVAGTLDQV
jgi:anti-sigma-K factor RskA